jgi:hypothetical protein
MKRRQDEQQQETNDPNMIRNIAHNHPNFTPNIFQMNNLQQPYFSLQQFHQQQQFHQYQFFVQQLLNQHLLQQQHSANPVNISKN